MAGNHSKKLFKQTADGVTVSDLVSDNFERDKPSLTMRIITVTAVVALAISAASALLYFAPSIANKRVLADAQHTFYNSGGSLFGLQNLAQKNPEIIGWLKVENTPIDYPVCQTDDDVYYAEHNFLNNKSRYGALYLSSSDSIYRTGSDKNIVIYGNNMTDGSMFGSLKNYRNLSFYKKNPTFTFTFGSREQEFLVFAVMVINSASKNSEAQYNPVQSHFSNEAEFTDWVMHTRQRSILYTDVQLLPDDIFITLITPCDDFEGARLAIMGKYIGFNSKDDINTDLARYNDYIG